MPDAPDAGQREPTTEIRDGIEFGDQGNGLSWEACARCGSSADVEYCENCGGDGFIEDEDEDGFDADRKCYWCNGAGSWWRCISSREWCEANPLPGREGIESTALKRSTA